MLIRNNSIINKKIILSSVAAGFLIVLVVSIGLVVKFIKGAGSEDNLPGEPLNPTDFMAALFPGVQENAISGTNITGWTGTVTSPSTGATSICYTADRPSLRKTD